MSAVKQGLRKLVAADELEAALEYLMQHTQEVTPRRLHHEAVLQSSRYEQYLKDHRLGGIDQATLARDKINIRIGILGIIERLPADLTASVPSVAQIKFADKRGISEQKLKHHVLILMIVTKFAMIAFLFTLWESGGFSTDQFMGTLTLLIPLFTTYTTLMMREVVSSRHTTTYLSPLRIKRSFQWTTYLFMIGYGLLFALAIGIKPTGKISYQQMSVLLTLLEGGFGIYVGRIVFALYKPVDE